MTAPTLAGIVALLFQIYSCGSVTAISRSSISSSFHGWIGQHQRKNHALFGFQRIQRGGATTATEEVAVDDKKKEDAPIIAPLAEELYLPGLLVAKIDKSTDSVRIQMR